MKTPSATSNKASSNGKRIAAIFLLCRGNNNAKASMAVENAAHHRMARILCAGHVASWVARRE